MDEAKVVELMAAMDLMGDMIDMLIAVALPERITPQGQDAIVRWALFRTTGQL